MCAVIALVFSVIIEGQLKENSWQTSPWIHLVHEFHPKKAHEEYEYTGYRHSRPAEHSLDKKLIKHEIELVTCNSKRYFYLYLSNDYEEHQKNTHTMNMTKC